MKHLSFESWIKELQTQGLVCTPYEHAWITSVQSSSHFDAELLNLGREQGAGLYIIQLHALDDEQQEQLMEWLPVYRKIVRENRHAPSYLMVAPDTKAFLAAGLGRKNKLFIQTSFDDVVYQLNDIEKPNEAMESFLLTDPARVIFTLLDVMSYAGVAMTDYLEVPHGKDELQEALEEGPQDDELYYVDGVALEEFDIAEYLDALEGNETVCEEAQAVLVELFPNEEVWNLNSGDH